MSGKKLGQILEKPCVCSIDHIFILMIMKLDQHVCLVEMCTNLKMGHVESKTRSLGQILEKPCVCSRGHGFCQIIMKTDQTVCFDEISVEFETGSCRVKN